MINADCDLFVQKQQGAMQYILIWETETKILFVFAIK